MGKVKRFTPEEDDAIFEAVSNTPNNISQALKDVAEKINRSFGSLNVYWYSKLRHRRTILTVLSSSGATINNIKNSRANKDGEIDALEAHHTVIKLLLDLPSKRRKQILALFK